MVVKKEKPNCYPLLVPQEFIMKAQQEYGKDEILTNIEVAAFDLQFPEQFVGNQYEVLKQRLEQFKQLFGRAPPELAKWNLIITTNLKLTEGNVAACDINSQTVYLHPYFFELPESKQLEILYHELISHITKGITDEDEAMRDTIIQNIRHLISEDIFKTIEENKEKILFTAIKFWDKHVEKGEVNRNTDCWHEGKECPSWPDNYEVKNWEQEL